MTLKRKLVEWIQESSKFNATVSSTFSCRTLFLVPDFRAYKVDISELGLHDVKDYRFERFILFDGEW